MRRLVVLAIVLAAAPALAQPGAISGTVLDSIRSRPFAGATVRVDGSALQNVTDADGHFRIIAVPAGPHRVTVTHPWLDSLELTVQSSVFTVPPNTMVTVSLATPSAPTILTLYCRPPARVALLSGRVSRVDGDETVPGAAVIVGGRATKTDSAGRYHMCVSQGQGFLIRARLESQATSYLPPSSSGPLLHIDLRLPRLGDSTQASILGRAVIADSGGPVSGASITLLDTPAATTAGADGRFQLTGLPTGSQVLVVRSVGRDVVVIPVELSARAPQTMTVSMQRTPPTLAPVTVVANRAELANAYERIGFAERKRMGIGRFLTEDQIRQHPAETTGDVLNGMAGITIGDNGDHGIMGPLIDARQNSPWNPTTPCTLYVVDGQVLGGEDYARAVPPPEQVIGIEIYRQGEPKPITLPGEAAQCAEVVVWTKAMLRAK